MTKTLGREDLDEQRKRLALERAQEKADLSKVMSTPEGRRLMLRILNEAGLWRGGFDANALRNAFFNGQRDFGLWLLSELEAVTPEALVQVFTDRLNTLKESGEKKRDDDSTDA